MHLRNNAQVAMKRTLSLLFFIMLMDVVGITILYPVAPYIVGRYSPEAIDVTLLTVIYAAAQFFAAPILGRLSDYFGRRPVLLASILGSAAGYVIFGLGGALWVLFLSRLIDGISGGNMSTASAYIADISQPDQRARNFTLIGMAWGLGLIIGPAIGAVAGQVDLAAPAYIAAALSLLSLLLGFLLLPESLPRARRASVPIRVQDLNPFLSIAAIAAKAGLGRPLAVLCLFNFAFNGMNSTETLFVIHKFAAQPWQVGLLLALIGIAIALVQVTLIPRLVPRYGETKVAISSLLGQSLGALATFLTPVLWLAYPVIVVRSAVSGFIFPSLNAINANRVSDAEQGILMGVTTALGSLMSIFGPLWAGAMYDRVAPSAPYWLGALVFALAAVLLTHGRLADSIPRRIRERLPD